MPVYPVPNSVYVIENDVYKTGRLLTQPSGLSFYNMITFTHEVSRAAIAAAPEPPRRLLLVRDICLWLLQSLDRNIILLCIIPESGMNCLLCE